MDIRQPEGKDRVKIHSDIIAYGILFPVLGDSDHTFPEVMPTESTYEMPHVTNDNFQFVKVYDNHPMIGELISKYKAKGQVESSDEQTKLEEYCKRIKESTFAESREFKSSGRYWSAPSKRNDLSKISVAVDKRVKKILREMGDPNNQLILLFEVGAKRREVVADQATPSSEFEAGGGAEVEGGSRRRRRPSRKYKKSKRVLRRKSRSTRRR